MNEQKARILERYEQTAQSLGCGVLPDGSVSELVFQSMCGRSERFTGHSFPCTRL